MKVLSDILYNFKYELYGNDSKAINRIAFDSRTAAEGDLFVALKGTAHDGHKYIGEVIKKGVSVVLCETIPKVKTSLS